MSCGLNQATPFYESPTLFHDRFMAALFNRGPTCEESYAERSVLAIIFRQCQHVPKPVTFKKLRAAKIINNNIETITALADMGAEKLLTEAGL